MIVGGFLKLEFSRVHSVTAQDFVDAEPEVAGNGHWQPRTGVRTGASGLAQKQREHLVYMYVAIAVSTLARPRGALRE